MLDQETYLRDEAGDRRDARRTPWCGGRGSPGAIFFERVCEHARREKRHRGFLQITDESRSLLQLRLLGVEVVGGALDAVSGRQTFHIGPHGRFRLLSAPI